MAGESEDTPSGLPWYVKFFEYWKNRNRIGPGKVELPDCDFFIVGPRRTLRVLRPPLKSDFYYEIATDRPESINDNFFTRWSKRPHSSGNCRCSFRQSDRLSSPEEQIISDQLNRIGTNIRDAEKAGKRVERLEEKISLEFQKYQITGRESNLENSKKFKSSPIDFIKPQETISPCDEKGEEQAVKYKIIKDLEQYINVLLEEILDDTVKFIASTEDTIIKDIQRTNKKYSLDSRNGVRSREESPNRRIERTRTKEVISLDDISFSFHADESEATRTESRSKDKLAPGMGYVNRAFIGTTVDPDSLEFYLHHTMPTEMNLEQLDCTDSGINSVETIEFQPDQEPSLEQSLLQIIDEKLGRSPCRDNMEYLNEEGNDEKNVIEGPATKGRQPVQEKVTVRSSKRKDKLDSTENAMEGAKEKKLDEDSDDTKSQLNIKNGMRESLGITDDESKSAVNSTDERLVVDPEDQEDVWHDQEQTTKSTRPEHNPRDFVMFRKSRKPMIVFLHGFGSSAEIFEHQLEYFSALGYPCIAPDMLGHGMSSAPNRARDYHFNKLLTDLDVVLNHYAFKPDQKCILVAHNYGCSFATALACKYDTSIHQLVLISGGGPTPLAPPSTESAGHWCLRAVLAPFLMCGLHKGILYSARGRQHPYCGPEPVEQWPSHMKYILDGMVWPEGDYVFHRRICTPTLLIHGLRDNGVSLVQECQMERTMLKAFLEAIPVAGHSPMTDCPEQLNHMIHCFIDLWKSKTW